MVEAEGRRAEDTAPEEMAGRHGVLQHQAAPQLLSSEAVQQLQEQEEEGAAGGQIAGWFTMVLTGAGTDSLLPGPLRRGAQAAA